MDYKTPLLEMLPAVVPRLKRTIESLTPAELEQHAIPGKWSIREYVEHIVSVHIGWSDICYEAVCPFHPEIRAYRKDWAASWLAELKTGLDRCFEIYAASNAEMLAFLAKLPPESFSREYPPVQWLVKENLKFVIKESVRWGLVGHLDHSIPYMHRIRLAMGRPLPWMAEFKTTTLDPW